MTPQKEAGVTDGTGGLRADGERHQAGGDRGARSAGGAARPAGAVPRIEARAGERGGGETVAAAAGEFHHREFAGEHGARAGELVDHRGVVIEDLAGVGLGAPGGGLSGEGEQILDAVGNALQQAAIALRA